MEWVWGPGEEEMLGRGLHVGSGGDKEKAHLSGRLRSGPRAMCMIPAACRRRLSRRDGVSPDSHRWSLPVVSSGQLPRWLRLEPRSRSFGSRRALGRTSSHCYVAHDKRRGHLALWP